MPLHNWSCRPLSCHRGLKSDNRRLDLGEILISLRPRRHDFLWAFAALIGEQIDRCAAGPLRDAARGAQSERDRIRLNHHLAYVEHEPQARPSRGDATVSGGHKRDASENRPEREALSRPTTARPDRWTKSEFHQRKSRPGMTWPAGCCRLAPLMFFATGVRPGGLVPRGHSQVCFEF
jgi:hypothetical protein